MTPRAAAELVGVSRAFRSTLALDRVDLAVHPGEVVALLGPNGAGKTTAIRILVGLRRADRGRALLFGRDPHRPSTRARLGCTPQETSLPATLTTRETIELVRAHYRRPAPCEALLARFDLCGVADRQTGGLSGGQRRRLTIALAFAGGPDLLVLDEPTTGLDVAARRAVWDAVREHADGGGAALLTTHYLEEAEALASRIVVIAAGRIRAEGDGARIREQAGLSRIALATPDVPEVPGVVRRERRHAATTLYVRDVDTVIRELVDRGASLDGLEVSRASLEEAFLVLTGAGR